MKILYRFIITCLPVLFIAPFIIISFYNHPALDDWWYAEAYKQFGLFGAQEHWYMNYTGRFVSNFIMTFEPLSFSWIEGHKFTPILYLICLYCTIVYAAKNIFKGIDLNKYLLSAWIMLTYLLIQRDYFEGIYWLAANTLYQVTFLFTILYFILLHKIEWLGEKKKKYHLLLLLFGCLITGSNETLGGLILAATGILLIRNVLRRNNVAFYLLLLLVLLASWAVMFAAPGNWKKIQYATDEHIHTFELLPALKYSFLACGYYAVYLLKQPAVWCIAIVALPLYQFLLNQYRITSFRNVILVICCSAAIAFSFYFISMFPTGIFLPPLRVTNIAVGFLFSSMMVFAILLFNRWQKISAINRVAKKYRYGFLLAAVVFACFTSPKYNQLLTDLFSGKAGAYNKEMNDRYTLIKEGSEAEPCNVPSAKTIPRTIIATDVSGPVGENMGLIFGKHNKIVISP